VGALQVAVPVTEGLINELGTCEEEGLSSKNATNNQKRIDEFGRNSVPLRQSILRESAFEERSFIVNFLLYLLTLSICVKLILLRDELRGVYPLGVGLKFQFRIVEELTSFILVIVMILVAAMVNVRYFEMDQGYRKNKNGEIKVKRDGECQVIKEEGLMVGDILMVEVNGLIPIDGILLKGRNLMVSEAHTILHGDTKLKK
jgi:magnesium-transporting ATPase (P-type)